MFIKSINDVKIGQTVYCTTFENGGTPMVVRVINSIDNTVGCEGDFYYLCDRGFMAFDIDTIITEPINYVDFSRLNEIGYVFYTTSSPFTAYEVCSTKNVGKTNFCDECPFEIDVALCDMANCCIDAYRQDIDDMVYYKKIKTL